MVVCIYAICYHILPVDREIASTLFVNTILAVIIARRMVYYIKRAWRHPQDRAMRYVMYGLMTCAVISVFALLSYLDISGMHDYVSYICVALFVALLSYLIVKDVSRWRKRKSKM